MPRANKHSGPEEPARKNRQLAIRATSVVIGLGLLTAVAGGVILAIDREVSWLVRYVEESSLPEPGWLGLGLLVAGLFTANMARMLQIWKRLSVSTDIRINKRSDKDRAVIHQGFRELFAYGFVGLAAITALMYLSAEGYLPWSDLHMDGLAMGAGQTGPRQESLPHIFVTLGCLLLTLTPPISAIYLQARHDAQRREDKKILRDDGISPASFWLGALLLGGIIGLASWAGSVPSLPDDTSLLINLCVMFGVVLMFVAFIFIPHVARYINTMAARNSDKAVVAGASFLPLAAPAQFVSRIDSILVRLIAPLTGATQKGRGIPHLFVLLSLLPLTALGFVLAAPFGLVPIILGIIMIIALGRRWAWIEEDRETASRLLKTSTPEIQVGFENDLKDEALLGYALLFIFVPLALYQINGTTGAFEMEPGYNPFVAWLAFFGSELAKAVPFVDWWEIYSVNLNSPIQGTEIGPDDAKTIAPLAKHLTFAARAMVDLVIMAALLQAIGIWQRSRAQRHLYEIGHVNHFDPFTEQDFFEDAFSPKSKTPRPEFLKKVKKHIDARLGLRLPGEPYNPERLADLLNSDNQTVRKTALWMIEEYQLLTGPLTDQLDQLRDIWLRKNIVQLAAKARHDEFARENLRREKLRFEQLLMDIRQEIADQKTYLPMEKVGVLLFLLQEVRSSPEFSYARIIALDVLAATNQHEFSLAAFAAHLMRRDSGVDHYKDRPDWADRIDRKFGFRPRVYLGNYELRQYVYDAIEHFAQNVEKDSRRMSQIFDLLEWMSEADGSSRGKKEAKLSAERLRAHTLTLPTPNTTRTP